MIPKMDEIQDFETAERQTSKTYKMHFDRNRITGHTDGLDAVKQAVYKILNTERYQYIIYSWNYGIELSDLFGMPVSYVQPELQRRITEALTQDDRINSVDAFSFTVNKSKVSVTFTVHSVFGDFEDRKEVDI